MEDNIRLAIAKPVLEKIIRHYRKAATEERKRKLPEPHPLDFSLSTAEEEQEKRNNIECHNGTCEAVACAYEDVAFDIQHTFIDIPESLVYKDYGTNI